MNNSLFYLTCYLLIGCIYLKVFDIIWRLVNRKTGRDLCQFLNFPEMPSNQIKSKTKKPNFPILVLKAILLWPLDLYLMYLLVKASRSADELGISTFDQYLKLKDPEFYSIYYYEYFIQDEMSQKLPSEGAKND